MEEKAIICADVIAKYQGKIVLVQRFTHPAGLALPGGKQDPGEFLSKTARREFFEETGLTLEIDGVLKTFAEKNRDPRGRYISTIFTGKASGLPKDEPGKTKVIFLEIEKFSGIKEKFIFDHREILEDYLDLQKTGG
jgi:8-oxo-dGTP diphosphatase